MNKPKYAFARKRNRKPVIAALAAILVVVLCLGGAFAWTDFTQSKTNKFNGSFDADVTLHDEFDGTNKNVFVENSGTNPIYVRVRLDEFMQTGSTVFDSHANIKDKTTWTTHTYTGSDIDDCGNADVAKFHSYYKWDMSGNDRDYTPGTPGMVYTTLGPDGKVLDEDTSYNPYVSTSVKHHTAAANAPVLMSQYLAVKAKVDAGTYDYGVAADKAIWDACTQGCWILDDTDGAAQGGGWAYWSQPLAPDTATNMLLQTVTKIKDPADDWIYRIDVKCQAVSLTDAQKWNDATSTCGYKTTNGAQSLISAWVAAEK